MKTMIFAAMMAVSIGAFAGVAGVEPLRTKAPMTKVDTPEKNPVKHAKHVKHIKHVKPTTPSKPATKMQ